VTGNLFEEIMVDNILNLEKETDIQVQEAERAPSKLDPKRSTPRHIIIKISKIKNRENLKSSKRRAYSYVQGNTTTLSADFSAKTLQARRKWHDIFKGLKGKKPTSKNTLPRKVIIQN